ncbi:hypothetical protein M2267_005640 [Ensifer sp. KUDG1]|uniref:hypothetical protein n=1 Tax=Ensifer sp. KUDG1 TaxID=3373919 RepID=UPI003D1F6A72
MLIAQSTDGQRPAQRPTAGGDGDNHASQSISIDELVEATELAVSSRVLVKEEQLVVIKNEEELLPRDWLKSVLRLTEINPQDAIERPFYSCGATFPRLGPLLNFIVIIGGFRLTH